MSNEIPQWSRTLVKNRAHGRCERCGIPAANGEWHHRRSRRVIDAHRHCACNGAWLCGGCHRQVHRQSEANSNAKADGFILSQWVPEPRSSRIATPWGVRLHGCDGTVTFTETGATT